MIWVDFDWGEDIYRARQTVTEKLSLASAALPDGVDPPVLAPLSSIMGEIMFVALQSDTHDPLDLRTTADVLVRRRLLAVHGVSQVTVIGGARRQFEVLVDPLRLSDYALSLSAVEDALRRANRNTAAGFRQTAGQEYLIQGVGRLADVAEIGATVIDTRGTGPIRVDDVAGVRVGAAPKRGDGSRNGRPAVILGIQRQPGVNTLALTRELDVVLDQIRAELPAGMRLESRLFRQADFIELAFSNLTTALRDGTLLVIVVTLIFLANLRAGAITLLAIPLVAARRAGGAAAVRSLDQHHDPGRDGDRGGCAGGRCHRGCRERDPPAARERDPPRPAPSGRRWRWSTRRAARFAGRSCTRPSPSSW